MTEGRPSPLWMRFVRSCGRWLKGAEIADSHTRGQRSIFDEPKSSIVDADFWKDTVDEFKGQLPGPHERGE